MPMYEYKCPECETQFEKLQRVAERKSAPCPECGQPGKQQLTTASFDPRMGLDPDFSTAWDKWGKSMEGRTSGKIKDSTNQHLTSTDVDKVTWESKTGRKAD